MINKAIYLVSLDSDTKRREVLENSFPVNYPNFIRISAVDGRKLPAKLYYNKIMDYFRKFGKILSPSELGCTLSHIKALENFLESDSEYALILEDDVIGNDSDIDEIFSLTNDLLSNSLVICGGQEGLNSKKYQFGKKSKVNGLDEVAAFSYNHIFRTCCYLVTRNSAKAILNYQEQGVTLADKWDDFFKGTDIKIYYKNSLTHPEDLTNSHIEQDRALFKNESFYQKLFSKNIFKKITNKLFNESQSIIHLIKGYKRL